MSSLPEGVDVAVRSLFKVKDVFQLPEGEVEYRVTYGPDTKLSFERLHKELAGKGMTPWLLGSREDCVLMVRKTLPLKPQRSRIPVTLALLTAASIVAFAFFEGEIYPVLAPEVSAYAAMSAYALGVGFVLLLHDLAHRYLSRRQGTAPPTPYVVPGIPLVTYFLPAVGIVSQQRGPAVNRDRVFDAMFVGPAAALFAAILLAVVGVVTSVQTAVPLQGCQAINDYISACQISLSVLQSAIDSVLSPLVSPVGPGLGTLSPFSDAATVGFLLTFLGFLPLAFFDGGYLAAAAFGGRAARAATYLGVLVLIVFDTPNYWAVAIVVLLMAGRQMNVQTCDEISGVSDRRRALFLLAILVAFLAVPLPQNLASFPLG